MFDIYIIGMLFLSPILWGMSSEPRWILWSLCLIHFLVVFTSKFSYGVVRLLPMKLHGFLELLVGLSLPCMPYVFNFADRPDERHFFIGAGFLLLVFWFLTDYSYKGSAWTKGAEIGGHSHDDQDHPHPHDHDHGGDHSHDHSHAH
jgi:hypothetical protein